MKKFLTWVLCLLVAATPALSQDLTRYPTPTFNSGTFYNNNKLIDVMGSWNGSRDEIIVSPGNNIAFYGLAGYVPGDHQRASIYSYLTSKYGVDKGEYAVNFDYKVTTGRAVDWFASAAFQPNDLIHGRASGQDGIYKMVGSSACVTASSGSGPSGLTPGVSEADGTCTWQYQYNGITDGKVGLSNVVATSGNAGHTWGMANNTVYGAPLYRGSFIASAEFDLQIGERQDCIQGFCNAYNLYLTGIQGGTSTAEIGISRNPADANLWTANTSYLQYQIIRTNVGGTDRVYRTQSSNPCVSGTTMPSGTGNSIADGTCVWEYIVDGKKPFAAHYGILVTGSRAVKDAVINDSTNADRGIQFFGQHATANIDATSQSGSTTPYFAKLPQGQSICFNGSTQCFVSEGANVFRYKGGSGFNILEMQNTASATSNYVLIQNAGSTFGPIISAAGGDTNVPLNIQAKGTSPIQMQSGLSITASNGLSVGGNLTIGGATATFSNLPTTGTAKGTVCIDTSNRLYVKTTTGACL